MNKNETLNKILKGVIEEIDEQFKYAISEQEKKELLMCREKLSNVV